MDFLSDRALTALLLFGGFAPALCVIVWCELRAIRVERETRRLAARVASVLKR